MNEWTSDQITLQLVGYLFPTKGFDTGCGRKIKHSSSHVAATNSTKPEYYNS